MRSGAEASVRGRRLETIGRIGSYKRLQDLYVILSVIYNCVLEKVPENRLECLMSQPESVTVRITEEIIPTYLPAAPDKHPMFLEKRVYQGSSGKVYPLPFTDRIAETKTDRAWKAIWLENEYLRGHGAAGDRRADSRRPGQDQRLRFHLSPDGHQAGAGRIGRAVDFRRNRVQLAAAPSAGDVPAGRFSRRGTCGRLENRLAQRPRSDGADERHARRLPASGQGARSN